MPTSWELYVICNFSKQNVSKVSIPGKMSLNRNAKSFRYSQVVHCTMVVQMFVQKQKLQKKTYAGCTIGVTMGNQKQKGQSDGSDSDWTLCRTNLLLDICSFYPGFSLEVVFQFLNDKISIFSWFGVHNPLKSFPKPHRPN